MAKIQSILTSVLLLCLTAAVGYLGIQYAALQTAWEQSLQSRTAFQENSDTWNKDLEALKTVVTEQQTEIAALKNQWQSQMSDFKQAVEKTYLPKQAPLALGRKLFDYNESTLTTVADSTTLLDWIENNQFYLDEILDRTLTLTYDPANKGALISSLYPESIFAQMGLQEGDRLVGFNGQPITRSLDLKQKLLQPENAKVAIVRKNQNLNLAITYVNHSATAANQENEKSAAVRVSEVLYQNQKAVKVVEVDEKNTPALKPNDLILSINGQSISSSAVFYDTLKNSESPSFSFDIVRNGENQQIDVAFSNDED